MRLANDPRDQVVITGIGVVSPIGQGKDGFWSGLMQGRNGIKPVTLFDTTGHRTHRAGEITDFRCVSTTLRHQALEFNDFSLLTLAAC